MSALRNSTKTVVVLGASYGGARAAQVLAANIPHDWRVILVDRNSHANHVYVLPRYSILPGHEVKAFIPYNNVFRSAASSQRIILHAELTSISPSHITLSKAFPEHSISTTISYDYAVYALGSHLPSPLNLWAKQNTTDAFGGTKVEAVQWLKKQQAVIASSDIESVLVVGGGALGIQYATDIKSVYPSKKVTLLHSRDGLLPKFDARLHSSVLEYAQSAGIDLILGERLVQYSPLNSEIKKKAVRTDKGREISADLILLCTGQTPNTDMLKTMDPRVVRSNNLIKVLRTLQVARISSEESEAESPYPHIFAIGDAADAFGAIAAGHTAHNQGEVAARNIIRLINNSVKTKDDTLEELEKYTPGLPGIKVSLGLHNAVFQREGKVETLTAQDCVDDLNALYMWPNFGVTVEKEEDIYL